jgi:hypothetical protein
MYDGQVALHDPGVAACDLIEWAAAAVVSTGYAYAK